MRATTENEHGCHRSWGVGEPPVKVRADEHRAYILRDDLAGVRIKGDSGNDVAPFGSALVRPASRTNTDVLPQPNA